MRPPRKAAAAKSGGTQEGGASPSPTKSRSCEIWGLDGFGLGVGRFGIGGKGIEAEEFGIVVQEGEVWIAAGPDGILEAGFPGLFDCFEGFAFALQDGVRAGGVVKDGRFVGAESDGHV